MHSKMGLSHGKDLPMKKRKMHPSILPVILLCLVLLLTATACGRESVDAEGDSQTAAATESAMSDNSGSKSDSESSAPDEEESASPESSDNTEGKDGSDSSESGNEKDSGGKSTLSWPVEFENWDIPTIQDVKLTFADNKSAAGNALTQGVTASVIIDGLTREQFDQYTKALLAAGFEKAEGSIDVMLQAHEKTVPEGIIRLMLTHDEKSTSIIATHSGAEAQKNADAMADAGKGPDTKDWPDVLKALPTFPAGAFKEMIAMGDNFFTLTWLDVTQADWDAYVKTLEREGYAETDMGDTTGYIKMDSKIMTNVSGVLTEGTLKIIVVTGSME